MKKTGLILTFGFLAALIIFTSGLPVSVSAKSYYYQLIEVNIQINEDSTFDVSEKQSYRLDGDFGYFVREIELKDLDHLSNIEVFDGSGNKLKKEEYQISYEGNREVVRWDFPRRIFNNEIKTWTVKYKVHGGLSLGEARDELYWNAIFPDREVDVNRAEVTVLLPQAIAKEDICASLFIGDAGNKILRQTQEVVNGQTVKFWGDNIRPGEYLSFAVGWPAGLIHRPFLYRNQIINWIVLVAALALPIFLFVRMYLVWRKKGRDPKIKKTIMAEYEPPEKLSPAIFGVLIDQEIQMKDITATIIDLAVRGYIKVIEKEKKFGFFKNKDYAFRRMEGKDIQGLREFEKKVIRGIFGGRDSVSAEEVGKDFYSRISGIKEAIYKEVEKTDYFKGNISKVRKTYSRQAWKIFILNVLLFIAGFVYVFLFPQGARFFVYFLILEASLVVSGIIIMVFAYYMPVMTQAGVEAKWKLLGFKEYLQKVEKVRMERETADTFSKFLPYAVILGVEKEWAERFSELPYKEQGWYAAAHIPSSSGGGVGGAAAPSFGTFSASVTSFASSISSSFGGSSSGAGGVGGGGGGAGGGGGGGGGGAG